MAELIVHKIETLVDSIEYTAHTDRMAMLSASLERVARNCQSADIDTKKDTSLHGKIGFRY